MSNYNIGVVVQLRNYQFFLVNKNNNNNKKKQQQKNKKKQKKKKQKKNDIYIIELLGLNVIYSVTVGSSSRLLGCWVFYFFFFLMEIYNGGPNIYVCLYLYIYGSNYHIHTPTNVFLAIITNLQLAIITLVHGKECVSDTSMFRWMFFVHF